MILHDTKPSYDTIRFNTKGIKWYDLYDMMPQAHLFAQLVFHEINWYSLDRMSLLMPKFIWPGTFMFLHH